MTIAPSGDVTDVRLASSELGDAELERKLVARVKMFKFEAKDVVTMTTTKPIEFFPAQRKPDSPAAVPLLPAPASERRSDALDSMEGGFLLLSEHLISAGAG